jgi:hypothetical protein
VATVKMVILLISRLGRQNGRGTCVYTVNNILYVYTAYPHQRQVEKKVDFLRHSLCLCRDDHRGECWETGGGEDSSLNANVMRSQRQDQNVQQLHGPHHLRKEQRRMCFLFFLSLSLSWGYEEQHDGHTTNQLIEIEQSRQGCLFRDQNGRHGRNSYIQIYS